jgi:hypothetical protein
VFGSLARGEFTEGSDLDWTILIDGRADSDHLELVHTLKRRLRSAEFGDPGPTGVFGGLVFSHELIHAIGGEEDTNRNMTRRLLLLLESKSIDARGSKQAYERVVSGILNRYVQEDASFISAKRRSGRLPRFLLNDVVRFWRTMAVDYANKHKAREGKGWALRNIKLRMSRKLLFVSGLFMCFSWPLKKHIGPDQSNIVPKLVDQLVEWTQRPPLDSLADIVEAYAPDLSGDIFESYDAFLGLNDQKTRELLECLSPDDAYKDDVFLAAREIATKFDGALTRLLFESNDDITQLSKKYGVF